MIKIKVFVPSYFKDFRCTANECPDTCCVGWEVDIDHETCEKYRKINGALGDKIKNHLTTDDDGDYMFTLCDGDRCPFLKENGLCEIQLSEGEKALSKTCTFFPRFFDDFGTFREMGLGFGCPEAARIMLFNENEFSLTEVSEIDEEEFPVDDNLLSSLLNLRKEIFTVLDKKEMDFKEKIKSILALCVNLQMELDGEEFSDFTQSRDFSDCLKVLKNMEYIKEERREFVLNLDSKKLSENPINYCQSDFEKLMKYYVFRYLLKAVYDRDVLTKVKYGVFACIVISRIYSLFDNPDIKTRIKIMYSYSKEVEYSDTNMDLLDDVLYGCFGTEDLTELL